MPCLAPVRSNVKQYDAAHDASKGTHATRTHHDAEHHVSTAVGAAVVVSRWLRAALPSMAWRLAVPFRSVLRLGSHCLLWHGGQIVSRHAACAVILIVVIVTGGLLKRLVLAMVGAEGENCQSMFARSLRLGGQRDRKRLA